MDYSVIIINYNLTNEVRNCVNSLSKFVNEADFEIILVDNHSEEYSILELVNEFSSVFKSKLHFIRTEKNIGFGNACNLGAKNSSGDVLFFLNPDTLVDENIFQNLKNEFWNNNGNKKPGIIGLNVNGKKWTDYSSGFFPNYLFEILNIFSLGRYCEAFLIKLKTQLSSTKRINVQWVMGAALLIRKDLFEMVNGFDPDYFLYFEEMDLCKRIIKRGLSVIYLSKIKIEHLGSAGSKRNYYFFTKLFYKGKLLFLKKHHSNSEFFINRILVYLHIRFQMILWWLLKSEGGDKSNQKIKAFKEILKNVNHPERISNSY